MAEKPKFKPEITRIRLNPEQALTICFCYNTGQSWGQKSCLKQGDACGGEDKTVSRMYYVGSAVSS